MRPLRILLITRRFWPLVGGAETVMANLATEFRSQGVETTVVTAQWSKNWPESCVMDDVPVVRLPQPAQRGWGTLRYMNYLNRWLRKQRDRWDLVYVSMLKHEAYTAVGRLAFSAIPVVLRAEGGGLSGDCHWQHESRFGNRIKSRCQQADALVAISPAIYTEMINAGYPSQNIHRIDNGVCLVAPVSVKQRAVARQSLAELHPDLRFPSGAKLAVYTGRLHAGKGLKHLIAAWPHVMKQWPTARLWLIGAGEEEAPLRDQIQSLGLSNHVALPGLFDSMDDILAAADLYLLPSFEEGMSVGLLEAMVRGLPSVVSDIPGNRTVAQHKVTSYLVPPGDMSAIADGIQALWSTPESAMRMGHAAREKVVHRFSLETVARRHLDLFEQLIENKKARGWSKKRSV